MPSPNKANRESAFQSTGAVEQDRPEQTTNVAPLESQMDHRYQDPLNKQNDSGLSEHGQTPEFSGQSQGRNELDQDTNTDMPGPGRPEVRDDAHANQKIQPETERDLNDQDPGERQKENQKKENQNQSKDDELAA